MAAPEVGHRTLTVGWLASACGARQIAISFPSIVPAIIVPAISRVLATALISG